MRVLLSWLREFALDIEGDPAELSDLLSALGLTVEEMTVTGTVPEGVVLGRVLGLRPHPDADRIQLVEVDDGSGETLQVCCGAFNMTTGDLVPLARVGTVMPAGMQIARRRMRGQASEGMCCSAAELALGDDAEGIMILNDRIVATAAPGTPLAEAIGLAPDVCWDLDVGANRPDAMSVMGVARDLAAGLGVAFEPPEWSTAEIGHDAGFSADVEIVDPTLCGRFCARVLRNVTVGSSPPWLANRLTALGMRPVNSIVDISNYVMLELGQPSHTFDLARVRGGRLRVRRACEGETLTTLDGVHRTLTVGDGVITDGEDQVISIAGVMGGASTEINASTTEVLLEMAWWDPPSISRTTKRHSLTSEASTRFRRGTDWGDNIERCLNRFAWLAAQSGAQLAPQLLDVRGNLPDRTPLRVRTARVNGLLGTDLSASRMAEHLRSIGFAVRLTDADHPDARDPGAPGIPVADSRAAGHVESLRGSGDDGGGPCALSDDGGRGHTLGEGAGEGAGVGAGEDVGVGAGEDAGTFEVTIPTWRWDTATETDIAEEVARLHGYERIERTVPKGNESGGLTPCQRDRRLVREVLVGAGCHETQPMPFVAPGALAAVGLAEDGITLSNPLDVNESVLRTSLLPGQLRAVAYNQRHFNGDVKLFEIGHVFLAPPPQQLLPDEPELLAVALSGEEAPAAVAVLDLLVESLALPPVELQPAELPGMHPTRSAELWIAGAERGVVGEVAPSVLGACGVTGRVAWLQLDLGAVLKGPRRQRRHQPVSKYPPSEVDLAFIVPDSVTAFGLERSLRATARSLLVHLELFDVYRGPGVPEDSRSLAYRLRFQAPDRTLTDAEVAEVRQRCIDEAVRRLQVTLRT